MASVKLILELDTKNDLLDYLDDFFAGVVKSDESKQLINDLMSPGYWEHDLHDILQCAVLSNFKVIGIKME